MENYQHCKKDLKKLVINVILFIFVLTIYNKLKIYLNYLRNNTFSYKYLQKN